MAVEVTPMICPVCSRNHLEIDSDICPAHGHTRHYRCEGITLGLCDYVECIKCQEGPLSDGLYVTRKARSPYQRKVQEAQKRVQALKAKNLAKIREAQKRTKQQEQR